MPSLGPVGPQILELVEGVKRPVGPV